MGDWVESAAPDGLGGPMTFSILPDHPLVFNINATCGTGWPKFGVVIVEDDSLFFQIDGYESRFSRWRYTSSGDSLILFRTSGRSSCFKHSP